MGISIWLNNPPFILINLSSPVSELKDAATQASYACGAPADTLEMCKKDTADGLFKQVCFCDTDDCNDIEKCACGTTPYANQDQNNVGNSAHGIIATAFTTVLGTVGALLLQ